MHPRPSSPLAMAALAAFGLGGCADDVASRTDPSGREAALDAAHGAERHDERKFLVTYGALPYRVNVRYVGMIGQSVVAVRRGAGEGTVENWPRLAVAASRAQPAGVPFGDGSFEAIAVEIAGAVGEKGGVCPGRQPMALRAGGNGATRTMYRDAEQAWVVFAACPKRAEG